MLDEEVALQHDKIPTIDKLASSISGASKHNSDIFEKNPNFTRVIIVGNSGIGKSTSANSLVGKKIIVKKNIHDNIYLHCEDPAFEIGDQMISMTTIPNIYVDENQHLIFCDAAGFNDVRGPNQEIFNSFLIDQLFTSPCQVKLLLVLSEGDISIEGKGLKAIENLQRLSKILPDKKQLKKSLGLILSQIDEEITPKQYLQNLMNGNPDNELKKWAKYFIKEKSKLFSFPKAKYEQVGNFYNFKDRSRILEFLHTPAVENPIHRVVLSESAKENIEKVSDHLGNLDDIIINMILKLRTNYDIENITIDQLNEWKNSYNQIIGSCHQIKLPIDLVNLFQKNIPNHQHQLDEYLDQIKCYNYMYLFKNHIDNFVRRDKFINFGGIVRNHLENEITQMINEKIKLKIGEADFQKGEQSKQVIIKQMDTIQKSHADNKIKYDNLNSSINAMNNQLVQERNNGRELTEKFEQLNRKLLKQQQEADNYGNEIQKLLREIEEKKEISQKEIHNLEIELQRKVSYYERKLREQTEEYRIESIGKYFGPFAPFYYIGCQVGKMIKNYIQSRY